MSLKWAINGLLDDIYFMAQGLPRLLFTWKDDNQLSILNFFEKNVWNYIYKITTGDEVNVEKKVKIIFDDQNLLSEVVVLKI